MPSELAKYGAFLVVVIALASGAHAGCSCSAGADAWSGQTWLEDTMDESSNEVSTSSGTEAGDGAEERTSTEVLIEADSYGDDDGLFSSSISAQELREKLDGDLEPVIVYVSNTPPKGSTYIDGSIQLPSKSLIQSDGSLKPLADLANVIGNAGITEEDDLVIYGDCFSCGDETFVFWIMKYLGHQNVQILQEPATGLPMTGSTTTRPAANYSANPQTELLADYETIFDGDVMVIDARSPDQFAAGHIEGAINIDYNRVIEGDWIKDHSALAEIFVDLNEDLPVAVYTKNGGQASIVWYALLLQGYDARLYTWNDWLSHQN